MSRRLLFASQASARRFLPLAAALLWQAPAFAQTAQPQDEGPPETVVIVGSAPLDEGVALDRVPSAAQQLNTDDLSRAGSANLLRAMGSRAGGVSLDEAQANPFQPNLLYRGFEASPLAGDPQGLAVYVDGARFNQPFGDTVDWDLIPDLAVSSLDVVASNPAFGLNALGGALSVRMKNGFDNRGGMAEISAGSFGRKRASAEYGSGEGPLSFYAAATALDENGWRDFSPSKLRQAYADVGWKGDSSELHASLTLANNELTGNGVAPVELLAFDRSAVFTHPDTTENRYGRLSLGGDWTLNTNWTFRARLYGSRLDRHTINGDAAEVEPCEDDDDQLCSSEDEDVELTDIDGDTVDNFITGSPYAADFPEFAAGGPYAFLNHTRTGTSGWGASVDGAKTRFNAGTTIGGLSLDRGWFGPGIELDTPDANIVPVSVHVDNTYWGAFVSDGIDLTPQLTATITARANEAHVKLEDQLGTALNGDHTFRRVDPAVGLSWRPLDGLSLYGGYSEASRAPTPAELSCADPDAPCSLTNFFVADPPLKQVVGHTVELGARGAMEISGIALTWHAGAYRTDIDDDIQIVASPTLGRGFFTNVGKTRRQGAELGVSASNDLFDTYAEYSWTDATYETGFDLNAGANPAFDDEDDIMTVEPGDRRPGIPEHVLKAGIDWFVTPDLTIGADAIASSGRYLVGDEANLNPKTDDYAVANAHILYRLRPDLELFAEVQNLFDTDYETFGAFSPVEAVPILGLGELENPRSLSPGAPRALFGGLRIRF